MGGELDDEVGGTLDDELAAGLTDELAAGLADELAGGLGVAGAVLKAAGRCATGASDAAGG